MTITIPCGDKDFATCMAQEIFLTFGVDSEVRGSHVVLEGDLAFLIKYRESGFQDLVIVS